MSTHLRCFIVVFLAAAMGCNRSEETPGTTNRELPPVIFLKGKPGGVNPITIKVENPFHQPVVLTDVRASCGCATVESYSRSIDDGGDIQLQALVKEGSSTGITVSFVVSCKATNGTLKTMTITQPIRFPERLRAEPPVIVFELRREHRLEGEFEVSLRSESVIDAALTVDIPAIDGYPISHKIIGVHDVRFPRFSERRWRIQLVAICEAPTDRLVRAVGKYRLTSPTTHIQELFLPITLGWSDT